MAFEISSTLLFFLTKEFQVLKNGKIEKIYQLDNENIIFRIYKESTKKNLRINAPSSISLTEQEFDAPTIPPGFCMFLRKYLTNARIESVEQKEFERILIIKLTKKEDDYYLIIELFKPGNVILCKKEENTLIILNSKDRQRFKDRQIQARKPYEFPPVLINPLKITDEELVKIVEESDRNLVKSLASKLGLGGAYSEEILSRAEIEKEKEKISIKEAGKIKKAIEELFSEQIKPFVEKENVHPVNMKTRTGQEFKTISEAIDSLNKLEKKEEKSKITEKKKAKTESLADIQEKMIKKLEKTIQENQEKGEFVYSNYQEFKKLIDEANKIRIKDGLNVLEKEMKKNKKFVSVNKKNKEINLKF